MIRKNVFGANLFFSCQLDILDKESIQINTNITELELTKKEEFWNMTEDFSPEAFVIVESLLELLG